MLPIIDKQTRLLVIAPHPDDETISAGGLLQQVRDAGGDIRIWLLTDGDNNPWPQRWLERRVWIGAEGRRRWGMRRRREVVGALRTLGLAPEQLEGFSWPDMGLTRQLKTDHEAMLDLLGARLRAWRPNTVVLPDLGDHHPDHGVAHVLLRLALAREGLAPCLLTYLVHGGALAGAGDVLALSPGQQATKREAMESHTSQTALSGARMRQLVERPEVFTVLPGHWAAQGRQLPWQPASWLHPWLRLTVADGSGVRSWRWGDAPMLEDEARPTLRPEACAGPGPRFAKLHMDIPSPWIFDVWGWCELA
ncbi:PIG-L family deacetylase [Dyella sp.]|uniref:PIG-L deacetylase family protein n=1 Tax=Dyella sp. TaxID=1869338 RepID=UPI002ED372D2